MNYIGFYHSHKFSLLLSKKAKKNTDNAQKANLYIDHTSIRSAMKEQVDSDLSASGYTGVTAKQSIVGIRMGPPAEKLYAVEPVGVLTMTPSAA